MLLTSALSEAPVVTVVRIFDRPASLRQGQIFKCVSFERIGQMKYLLEQAIQYIKVPINPGLLKHIIILSCTTSCSMTLITTRQAMYV